MAYKFAGLSLVLVCAILSQPACAQRGGGGGGGGHCGGGGTQTSSNTASALSPYTLSPLANPYALQQMQQQQYAQQAMAMRQMYAMQMENQLLRKQLMQQQHPAQVAQVKPPVSAQGDSNVLLASKKNSVTAVKKKASQKSRTDAQREKHKATEKAAAGKFAMNDVR